MRRSQAQSDPVTTKSTQDKMKKQENYELALRMAREDFEGKDKSGLVRDAGICDLGGGDFELEILGTRALYDASKGRLRAEDGTDLPLRQEVVLLHYLCTADGTLVTGKEVSFSQIPGAAFYDPVFAARIRGRTAGTFGSVTDLFEKAAMGLGATKVDSGDLAVQFRALPRVPITIVLWRGDEEFEPSSNFLFDRSISSYLCVEDIVVLCEELVSKLTKLAFVE